MVKTRWSLDLKVFQCYAQVRLAGVVMVEERFQVVRDCQFLGSVLAGNADFESAQYVVPEILSTQKTSKKCQLTQLEITA